MWEVDHKEGWAPKNWFQTVVLENTLENPLDCKWIKPVYPEYSLKGLMLKLKVQYFGHLMWKTDSLEKTLKLGKIEGKRRRGDRGWDGWMASPTQWTWVWVDSGSWWWTGRPGVLQSIWLQRVRHDWVINFKSLLIQFSKILLLLYINAYFFYNFYISECIAVTPLDAVTLKVT